MEHFYQDIYGWSHYLEPWYKYVVPTLSDNPKVVEVGCWHGRSTACLAVELINHKQTFELWAVDHWLGCEEPFYFQNVIKNELAADQPYQVFLKNMEPVINQLNIIRDTSTRAAEQFEDGSLDLIILDDEHSKEGVLHSIMAWWPKLKPNGIICGDDHDKHYPGVINAVREVFGNPEQGYQVFTNSGWAASFDHRGVWAVQKNNQNLDHVVLSDDPWALKIPFKTKTDQEPEVETVEESVSPQKEQTVPTSLLQNPNIRSII